MAHTLGKNAEARYNSTALTAAVDDTAVNAGTVVGNMMDLSVEVSSTFVDTTTRADAANGFRTQAAVLRDGVLTFDIQWQDTADAFTTALINAWTTQGEIAFFALDKAAGSGAQGLCGNFTVGLTKEEPLNDIQRASITLTASSYVVWHTMT